EAELPADELDKQHPRFGRRGYLPAVDFKRDIRHSASSRFRAMRPCIFQAAAEARQIVPVLRIGLGDYFTGSVKVKAAQAATFRQIWSEKRSSVPCSLVRSCSTRLSFFRFLALRRKG